MQHSESFAAGASADIEAIRALPHPLTAQLAFAGGDFPVAAENMRRLANEFAGMSARSLDQTRCLIEDMRDARQMDDLFAIQAKYVTSLLQSFTDGSRRIGILLADLPRDLTQAGCDMFEASVEAAQNVAVVATTTLAAANVATEIEPIAGR